MKRARTELSLGSAIFDTGGLKGNLHFFSFILGCGVVTDHKLCNFYIARSCLQHQPFCSCCLGKRLKWLFQEHSTVPNHGIYGVVSTNLSLLLLPSITPCVLGDMVHSPRSSEGIVGHPAVTDGTLPLPAFIANHFEITGTSFVF